MTIYLNRELFTPALIVLSAVFGVLELLFLILTIAAFHVLLLIVVFLLAAAYGALVYLAWWLSRSEKYNMKEMRGYLDISYPTINRDKGRLRLPYDAIIGFEYYSLDTKEGWLNFIRYGHLPGCTYLVYVSPYRECATELLGYVTKSDAIALGKRYGVSTEVK